ncbi:TetR/AcrR family transcriptional regulator [Pendulispora rubella]|uniref:TetR/AcrR family transcriptional regulator n=1 Tax=Pendulispora rubella TaxID=2741070 RepID=A0ABZ2L7J9_9BACT
MARTSVDRTKTAPARAPGLQLGERQARAMILQGAATTFAELGLRAASVEDILNAAGISRRTFYRLYGGKEDVALELYRLGTKFLLDACEMAVREEKDPIRLFERCIDAHLGNARQFGRLVFVLGGEAQRQESPLHARRMQVHDSIVELLRAGTAKANRALEHADPLLFRMLLLSIESSVRILLEEGDEGRNVSDASLDRARRVMVRVLTATLEGTGPRVTAIPTVE